MSAFINDPVEQVPAQTSYWTVRSLLLTMALIAVVVSHATAGGYDAIQLCAGASWLVGLGFAVGCAYATANSPQVRIRKLCCFAAIWSVFVACVSTIFVLRQSDIDFEDSGVWAPIPPDVLSVPVQFVCALGAFVAAWGLVFLISVVESQTTPQLAEARERRDSADS